MEKQSKEYRAMRIKNDMWDYFLQNYEAFGFVKKYSSTTGELELFEGKYGIDVKVIDKSISIRYLYLGHMPCPNLKQSQMDMETLLCYLWENGYLESVVVKNKYHLLKG